MTLTLIKIAIFFRGVLTKIRERETEKEGERERGRVGERKRRERVVKEGRVSDHRVGPLFPSHIIRMS